MYADRFFKSGMCVETKDSRYMFEQAITSTSFSCFFVKGLHGSDLLSYLQVYDWDALTKLPPVERDNIIKQLKQYAEMPCFTSVIESGYLPFCNGEKTRYCPKLTGNTNNIWEASVAVSGDDQMWPFLRVEWAGFYSLWHYIQSGRTLTKQQEKSLLLRVAQILRDLHKKNIIYRELTPQNIFISLSENDVEVKLALPGLAYFFPEDFAEKTKYPTLGQKTDWYRCMSGLVDSWETDDMTTPHIQEDLYSFASLIMFIVFGSFGTHHNVFKIPRYRKITLCLLDFCHKDKGDWRSFEYVCESLEKKSNLAKWLLERFSNK